MLRTVHVIEENTSANTGMNYLAQPRCQIMSVENQRGADLLCVHEIRQTVTSNQLRSK